MICIIPARGGSKRLPGKNIRALDGEPIITRVIKIAKDSQLFDTIVVSTDSKQIADIVRPFASVHMRPKEFCGDIAEDLVTKNCMKHYRGHEFCRIYPFAALLSPERLQQGYQVFGRNPNVENVHECQEYTHSIQRAIDETTMEYIYPDYVSYPTEGLAITYHEAGTYMFSTVSALDKPLAERRIRWMPISEMEAQDIDSEDDWQMLEAKWMYRQHKVERELIFGYKIGSDT